MTTPQQAASTAAPWMADQTQGLVCPAGWLKIRLVRQRRADPVAEHGEDHVPQERHPVLIEGDEADHDEEVEVGPRSCPPEKPTSTAEQ
jgi:hypothetical protein